MKNIKWTFTKIALVTMRSFWFCRSLGFKCKVPEGDELLYAQAGAAFGAALGYVGASQTLWVQYFAGITGLVAGALFIADSENLGH